MKNSIAIRREDLSKKGEQRVPITPSHVAGIVRAGHSVTLQPGVHPVTHEVKRAHDDQLFLEAGATVNEDISGAKVVFGLKEIALESILPDRVYYCFSHTHKGQQKNRKMLQTFVEGRCTLLDYELMVNASGTRTVTAFTYFAGYAGMIDTLWAMAQRLELRGIDHPFKAIPQAMRHDLDVFRRILAEVGEEISTYGTPAELPPLITVFLGKGKTSKGAQDIYNLLPVQEIQPEEIAEVYARGDRRHIYSVIMEIGEMFQPIQGTRLSQQDWANMTADQRRIAYFDHPSEFESSLGPILPYVSLLMNCTIWAPKYPRTLTTAMMRDLWRQNHNLVVIGDISCDPNGSIEFSLETWIDNPVFVFEPESGSSRLGMRGDGVAVMAVTNLPCEFSRDSSEQFSKDLEHLLLSAVSANYEDTLEASGLDPELIRSVILWKGEFTPQYAYMAEFLPSKVTV